MQKTKFKIDDNEYRIIAQSRKTLIAIRDLADCCLEANVRVGDTTELIKGEKSSVLAILCGKLCINAMAEADASEKDASDKPITFQLPGEKQYDPMKPTEVPGTSGGTIYKVLLTTHHGLISYSHGNIYYGAPNNKPPRIRIVKFDLKKSWNSTKINDFGYSFSTVENTHMSSTGNKKEDTCALIMRGISILFAFGLDF